MHLWRRLMTSAYECSFTIVIYAISRPKRSLSFPWRQLWFFYSYLFRGEIFKMQIYITILTAMDFAFLPVCLNNSFCIFEILHIKQSVMIHLSLAVSFFTDCGLLSFCRFSTSIPRKWFAFSFDAFCTWQTLIIFC